MKKPVLFDSNFYVSHLMHNRLMSLLQKLKPFRIISCKQQMSEIERVLFYKHVAARAIKAYGTQLAYENEIEKALPVLTVQCFLFDEGMVEIVLKEPKADPDDWYLTNLAYKHNAILVTDNTSDFITWRNSAQTMPIEILTVAEFFKQYGN
ncbi:MAG: PIN domain-containing protein [Chitinophagaceae bacterium]|nr:PIN domain-containing protein [Chitinophagaceae bacterium]